MLHAGMFPRNWKGDGILALITHQSDTIRNIINSGVPCVSVSMADECPLLHSVLPDNFAIGQLAAQHLLEREYRSFAWAPYTADDQNCERLRGFRSTLSEHNYSCQILPPAHKRTGARWRDDWCAWQSTLIGKFKKQPTRTGVFAYNDCVSTEVADAAQKAGLAVPEHIAIIGVGNEPLECESSPITLTSIDPNVEGMTYQAADLLADLMGKEELSTSIRTVRVPPKVIVCRDSSGAAKSDKPRIVRVTYFIEENFSNPSLSVATVAEEIGICRRQLERNFRDAMNCTVREHIEKSRMKEAARLLKENPTSKIASIAELIGISESGNFFRTFKRHYGVTPANFRKACTSLIS